jgi:hypothetical protein
LWGSWREAQKNKEIFVSCRIAGLTNFSFAALCYWTIDEYKKWLFFWWFLEYFIPAHLPKNYWEFIKNSPFLKTREGIKKQIQI